MATPFIQKLADAAYAAQQKPKADVSAIARRALQILKSKRLLKMFPQFLAGLAQADREARGIVQAVIESRYPLTSEDKKKIVAILSKKFNAHIDLEERINADVLGGFRVRCGDTVIDGTIQNSIKQLTQQITP